MGTLEPSWHLLLLPVLLTVGGELGASVAAACVSALVEAGARQEGTGQLKGKAGRKEVPLEPVALSLS